MLNRPHLLVSDPALLLPLLNRGPDETPKAVKMIYSIFDGEARSTLAGVDISNNGGGSRAEAAAGSADLHSGRPHADHRRAHPLS